MFSIKYLQHVIPRDSPLWTPLQPRYKVSATSVLQQPRSFHIKRSLGEHPWSLSLPFFSKFEDFTFCVKLPTSSWVNYDWSRLPFQAITTVTTNASYAAVQGWVVSFSRSYPDKDGIVL